MVGSPTLTISGTLNYDLRADPSGNRLEITVLLEGQQYGVLETSVDPVAGAEQPEGGEDSSDQRLASGDADSDPAMESVSGRSGCAGCAGAPVSSWTWTLLIVLVLGRRLNRRLS